MDGFNFDGIVVSVTEIRKNWSKIFRNIKKSNKPAIVFKNKRPEIVIIDYKSFQAIQDELEVARKEKCGKEIIANLLEIAVLENRPIPHMTLDEDGVFRKY